MRREELLAGPLGRSSRRGRFRSQDDDEERGAAGGAPRPAGLMKRTTQRVANVLSRAEAQSEMIVQLYEELQLARDRDLEEINLEIKRALQEMREPAAEGDACGGSQVPDYRPAAEDRSVEEISDLQLSGTLIEGEEEDKGEKEDVGNESRVHSDLVGSLPLHSPYLTLSL